jgi:hypothetical protein
MASESVIKAFEEYDSKMQKYAITHTPIFWDRKKKKLAYNGFFSNRKTTMWHLNVLLTAELGWGGGGILVLILQIFGIGIPLSFFQILILLVFSSVGVLMTGFHILLVMYVETFANGWNQLNSLEKELDNFGKAILSI